MADVIEHAVIPNQHLHEPKGVAGASAGQVYTADGMGSGAWETLSLLTSSSSFPVGTVMPFAGTTAPVGWAFCYGQTVGRSEYPALFAAIGVNYGIGDGSTTFQFPDCRGRTPVGKDNMGGSAANRVTSSSGINGTTIGASGGAEGVILTTNNVPPLTGTALTGGAHTHSMTNNTNKFKLTTSGGFVTLNSNDSNVDPDYDEMTMSEAGAHTHIVSVNTGVDPSAHTNVQPTIVMNMIIYHGVVNA